MGFFNDIFHNLALLEFHFLNIIYILLYTDFILSIFFQHSNILTRASHHWCLASNIVLVPLWYHDQPKLVPSPQYTSITLRYTIGDGKLSAVPGRHFSNLENTHVSWRLPNVYPESYDWGLPDHRLVNWTHGLTSLDQPRGLAAREATGQDMSCFLE